MTRRGLPLVGPRPAYTYRRTFEPEDLQRAARLWRRAPDGYLSRGLRHTGRVAWVADQLGLAYGYAAALVWDAFEEGLLVVEPPVLDVESALIVWTIVRDAEEDAA